MATAGGSKQSVDVSQACMKLFVLLRVIGRTCREHLTSQVFVLNNETRTFRETLGLLKNVYAKKQNLFQPHRREFE